MSRGGAARILGLLLVAGAYFRFAGVAWDEGHHLHPDERFISMVEEKLELPKSPAQYFDSARSPLNPYNRGFDSFVYGTLPVFVTKAVAMAVRKEGYDGAYIVGRLLSGFFDLATVWLVYLLARRFAGRTASLFAAAFLAFCPLAIQLSHFWAVDTYLATFATLVLLGAVRLARGRSGLAGDAATAVALGLAVACKVTALALLAPIGIALLLRIAALRREGSAWAPALLRNAGRGAFFILATAAAIRIFLPYAFSGWSLDPRYLRDMKQLAALSSSVAGFPPALQWAGRTLLFPLKNFLFWGAAPFFGVMALAALAWSLWRIWRRREDRDLAPLAAYVLFVGLYHGLTLVKSIRYFYPAYPALAVLAAVLLGRLAASPSRRFLRALPVAILACHFLAAVAFTSIYRRTNTRVEASRWIFTHVPPPARFANESWDDGLPMGIPGHDVAPYAGPALDLFDPDSAQKAEKLTRTLGQADWVAVTSNRVYGNVTRVPDVFPMSIAYYRALFDGVLGFEKAADFSSYPSLGPLSFDDDRAEEQFTVYDHPRVLLFRKTRAFSAERARRILLAAMPSQPPTMWDWEKWPRSARRVSAPVIPSHGAVRTLPAAAPAGRETGSLAAAAIWYLALAALGAAALPIGWVLFSRLPDRGFGFARVLGLVLASYLLNISVARAGVGNGRAAAALCFLLVAAAGLAAFFRRRRAISDFLRANRRSLLQSEAVFAAGFLLFLLLRAFNPEIVWGEKPMDFSILNILVRTRTLPASDPWFAGAPLGYYTFGQEMVAFLSLLTGLSTRYTFNLAFGLLGGAAAQGAFSLARGWAGTLKAGIAGAGFVTLAGNLAGLREWLVERRPKHLPLDWNYFWATSRVIKDTINEYPFWSLLFADLHAHLIALPLLLLFLAACLHFARTHADPTALVRTRALAAAALGFFAGVEVLTNAWDAPLVAGLVLLVALVAVLSGPASRLTSALRTGVGLTVAAAAALATALSLWIRGGGPPGWGRNLEKGASGVDLVTVFGVFFFLAFAWWLTAAYRRMTESGWTPRFGAGILSGLGALLAVLALLLPDLFCLAGVLLFLLAVARWRQPAEDRLACGLAATGFLLLLFTQRFYIYDRMNTFFKLYFAGWVLFAVATAVLVFTRADRPGSFERWPSALRGAVFVLLAAALFTTVTAARGAIDHARPTYREAEKLPTLDGLRYLEATNPGEYRAVTWLNRLRGTPVVLEAQGDSYREFGRVSMLTGLPTVLGWEYHVQQRGNPPSEIAARRDAVRLLYSSGSPDAIEGLLRRYHVGYVYVGDVERKTYPSAGLKKFDRSPDLFRVAYENPQVTIYRVVGGEAEDIVLPARESLPEVAAAPKPATDEPEEAPSILEAPAPDRLPWAGMKEPRDGAVDGKGRIWIADFGNSRLRIFDQDGGYLGGWGGRGNGKYGLRELCGVAIRGDEIYVADTWNGRVQAFALSGEYRATAAGLYGPRGVAAAGDGSVWVADTGNNRLMVYDASLTSGRIVGKKGSGPGELSSPVGIAAGPSGSVYVADTGNNRIEVFDASGRFSRSLAVAGWTGAVEPHIEVDRDETVYVALPSADAVISIAPGGAEAGRWTADSDGRKFARPTGLALDAKNRMLYVINSGNNVVSKIKLAERKER